MSEQAAPIRGLRTMAVVRWILLAFVAIVAAGTWWRFALAPEDGGDRPDRYYCPMHPQIRAPEAGTCPICFMNLEPIPHDGAPHRHDAGASDAGAPELELAPVMLTTERRQRAGIATIPARRVTLEASERWPASIEASEGARAEVRVRANAFVERLAIRSSNVVVRAGQTLAWVYSPELVSAQEELLLARRMAEPASPEHAAVESAARERLALLGMSARDVELLIEEGRARRTIPVRAPIGGHVTRFDAAVGGYATPEALLFEITDLSRVRVVATPFARDLSWLAAGGSAGSPEGEPGRESPAASARFEPHEGDPIAITLELVEPQVREGTRTLRVRFTADAGELGAAFRPGDVGEVIVRRPPTEAVVVPRDAVIDVGTVRYVFVEREPGLFEPRPIEIGELHEEQRVVTAGLEAGERVVARGAFVLDSESRLQAALAPAPRTGGTGDAGASP
jgi:Cu(I)/Ag(I) efflux system membrane fusion protein